MGEPTSQLSIRFLSTFRYICPVPHERRGEFREQPGGADEPKHHAEAAWPADHALFRDQFNAELRRPGSQARADKSQKLYYQGTDMEGRAIAPEHCTRLRVKPFAK